MAWAWILLGVASLAVHACVWNARRTRWGHPAAWPAHPAIAAARHGVVFPLALGAVLAAPRAVPGWAALGLIPIDWLAHHGRGPAPTLDADLAPSILVVALVRPPAWVAVAYVYGRALRSSHARLRVSLHPG